MDLQHLIGATKGARSYTDLEQACDGKLGAARWQQMATKPLRSFPTASSIAAIAEALHIPEKTVLLAVGASLGIDVRPTVGHLTDLFPPAAAQLPPDCIAALLMTVHAMLTMQEQARPNEQD